MDLHKSSTSRRGFFSFAGGLAAGMAVAVSGTTSHSVADEHADPKGGYRVTEHVKRVYELARF